MQSFVSIHTGIVQSYIGLVEDQGSHRPSFQPVRHLSSHLLQSNVFLPSFVLTALCASHIHCPNSPRELTLGAFPSCFIHSWKSVAQDQHGYSLPNMFMKVRVSDCRVRSGLSGYCAVMEWSSVQEERPRASTSGGQSEGSAGGAVVLDLGAPLVMASQEDTLVHVRQL
jgi:hypothetical protein